MAFKMNKPSIIEGTSVHKNAIKLNRDMDRTNADDGRAGSSAFQKKDFGIDESGMKFKKIGSKIREKLAARKKNKAADDPDFKRRDDESVVDFNKRSKKTKEKTAEKISKGTREERGDKSGRKQDIAQTGVTQGKKVTGKKLKEFGTDAEGNVTMSKVKTRGGKVVTKTVDAEGKKTKTVENLRKRKKLEKKLKDLDPTGMAVEGTKLSKKKAKLEKKIANTTKKKKPTTRRAAGETVKGKRHSQTVADARERLKKQYDEKTLKPSQKAAAEAEARNLERTRVFNEQLAESKKKKFNVVEKKTGEGGITMRSPIRKDDDDKAKVVKTVDLEKKGTTTTTPGTKTTPKKQKFKGMQDACSPEFIKANGPGACDAFKRKNPPKKTPPKTTTTPDQKKTLTLKQEEVPKVADALTFGEGKFNTLKITDKKKTKSKKNKGGVRGDGLVDKKKKKKDKKKKTKTTQKACPFPGLN